MDQEQENQNSAANQEEWSQEVNKGRILMQWQFSEYHKHDRSKLWYAAILLLGGLMMWYAVSDGNFLFALIILLFALIIFTHHRTDPLDIHCTVYDAGVQVGDRFMRFRELESFAIVYEPPHVKQLYISPKKNWIRGEVSVPLGDTNPVHVRELLIDFIEEDLEREEESLDDLMNRVLKL